MLLFFFFNEPATTEIYTLSLHDALPIYKNRLSPVQPIRQRNAVAANVNRGNIARQRKSSLFRRMCGGGRDRKSTRLNSSHSQISYAVFCLKKKKRIKKL